MKDAKLHTFGAEDESAYCDYDFFTRKALGNDDYDNFMLFLEENDFNLDNTWLDDLITCCYKYVDMKINNDDFIEHGDIYWIPAWKSPGWFSFRENGFYHVVDNGKRKILVKFNEGLPSLDKKCFQYVSYDNVYKELNDLTHYSHMHQNSVYTWFYG